MFAVCSYVYFELKIHMPRSKRSLIVLIKQKSKSIILRLYRYFTSYKNRLNQKMHFFLRCRPFITGCFRILRSVAFMLLTSNKFSRPPCCYDCRKLGQYDVQLAATSMTLIPSLVKIRSPG